MTKKRPVGRPMKRVKASDKRVTVGLRVTPQLKRQLQRDAEKTGRSLSQTAELRLEQSYDREWVARLVMAMVRKDREEEGK
jgi:predicted transcriptional regulator